MMADKDYKLNFTFRCVFAEYSTILGNIHINAPGDVLKTQEIARQRIHVERAINKTIFSYMG